MLTYQHVSWQHACLICDVQVHVVPAAAVIVRLTLSPLLLLLLLCLSTS
jgi:hypothetical protein